MKFHKEIMRQAWNEMDALLADYFLRTVAKEGLPPLDMNWRAYIALDQRGDLALCTARGDDDELLGFVMYLVHPHLHHIGTINASCDILAVHVDARGKGIARGLMDYAEPILRIKGAHYITHQFRTCYDVEPLFPKVGYRLIEQGYLKELT